MQSDLVGAAAGAGAIAAAFGAVGVALFTDYRGLTTWHARQTMPRRDLRGEPEDSRQYRLERYWIGGSFALVGCGSAAFFLGLLVYALF